MITNYTQQQFIKNLQIHFDNVISEPEKNSIDKFEEIQFYKENYAYIDTFAGRFIGFLNSCNITDKIIGEKYISNLEIEYSNSIFTLKSKGNVLCVIYIFGSTFIELFKTKEIDSNIFISYYLNPFFFPKKVNPNESTHPSYSKPFVNSFTETDNILKQKQIFFAKSFFRLFNSCFYRTIRLKDESFLTKTNSSPRILSFYFPSFEIKNQNKINNYYHFCFNNFIELWQGLGIKDQYELKTFLNNTKIINQYIKANEIQSKGVELISELEDPTQCCKTKIGNILLPLIRINERLNNKEITLIITLSKNNCIRNTLHSRVIISTSSKPSIESELTLEQYIYNREEFLANAYLLAY